MLETIKLLFQILLDLCKDTYEGMVNFLRQRRIKKMLLKMKRYNEKASVDFTIAQDRRITITGLLDQINLEHIYKRPITTDEAVIFEKEKKERILTILQNNLRIINQSLAHIKELEDAEKL